MARLSPDVSSAASALQSRPQPLQFERAILQELLQGASVLKNNQPSDNQLNLFQF